MSLPVEKLTPADVFLLRNYPTTKDASPGIDDPATALKKVADEIEKQEDRKTLTPELEAVINNCLYTLAIERNNILRSAYIKALADILKPLGVTTGAIKKELKKLSSGLGCDTVTDNPQTRMVAGFSPSHPPVTEIVTQGDLEQQAKKILNSSDPVELIKNEIIRLGYGGDAKAPLITYLALTSRLLKMRPGAMPVHLLLVGPPSCGKSYTLKLVLQLFPQEAYHVIDAGSPRVLIYDPEPLKHRALIFSEADSIPSDEDNPAASAIRNLAQDHCLHYKVVIKSETGGYVVRDVQKEGPTVLITTATRRLGAQLCSRFFTLDVSDDANQFRKALKTQANLEIGELPEPEPAFIAYQSLLQAKAHWDVVIPYSDILASGIGKSVIAPRILRDFARLLSLIKSVTILRYKQRQIDEHGRLIAEIDDYKTVYDLIKDMYESTVSGANKTIRQTVEKVKEIKSFAPDLKITYAVLGEKLGVHREIAKRRANAAIKMGWLVNKETRPGHPADLDLGEPMPQHSGLPEPDLLVEDDWDSELPWEE